MFGRNSDKKTPLDTLIDSVTHDMNAVGSESEDFDKMQQRLQKLYALKETHGPRKMSPDTKAIVAGNLAGIALILTHERLHPITTKALSFVMKAR